MVYFIFFLVSVLATLGIAEALGEKIFDKIFYEAGEIAKWIWSVTRDPAKQRFLAGALGPTAFFDMLVNENAPLWIDGAFVAISILVAYTTRKAGKSGRKE